MKRNIIKFYILGIIFVLFSSIFSPQSTSDIPIRGTYLSISNVAITPDPALEGDLVQIIVTISNTGYQNISAGQPIIISMKVDNEPSVVASLTDSLGLLKYQQRKENLTWVAALGPTQRRSLHITVTFLGVVEAVAEGEIRINERKTDLLFVSTPSISGVTALGKPITIAALIKNIGKNTTQTINVSLSIDKIANQWHIKSGGLIKGESFSVSFSWTPLTFGIHTINLTIDPKQTIIEERKSNNYYETTTSIIPWWNTSWHYRRVYNVIGVGNISHVVNFTTLLKSLQVVNKTFDNATITVVRYYTNGTMVVVNRSWFKEDAQFNNRTNAIGTLFWNVPGSSLYGVYFDVIENRGMRRPQVETLNLTQSGTIQASIVSTEGWWSELMHPFETYYELNTMLLVQVNTTAYAKKVTAFFSWNSQPEFNMSLNTNNYLQWSNTTKQLSKKGNWTIRIIASDDVGYQASILTAGFYIGKPDLALTALSMRTVCYINYNVTITANIRAVNTTVQHVNVALQIDNVNISNQSNLTIQKDENRTLQFRWLPRSKGNHTVSVVIFFPDSNPGNNKKSKTVTVEGIPDLGIQNITVFPTPVNEGNPVRITALINNTGDGNATDYTVILYCEQNQDNHTIYYNDDKNSTTVSLKKNEYKNVTLTWEKTRYGKASFNGEWAVGIQILNTTQTPDKHEENNRKALFHVLRVIPSERIPPVLSNLEYPAIQEQGIPVLIRVKATDASGIGTVVISIKNPNKTFINATMTAKENNRYEYLVNTTQLGRYNFSLTATDLSPSRNQSTLTGSFEIIKERTPPTITYVGVNPFVQEPDSLVEIRCITTDLSGIKSVEVAIRFPNRSLETHALSSTLFDSKFVYASSYELTGKYVFVITVEDNEGNIKNTDEKTFWITEDLDDADSDGIPDAWEEHYGFDPYDPTDATLDADKDGATNLKEYQRGTNPLKALSSSAELIDRLQENWAYLTASLLVCAVIVILAWYGIRRRKP